MSEKRNSKAATKGGFVLKYESRDDCYFRSFGPIGPAFTDRKNARVFDSRIDAATAIGCHWGMTSCVIEEVDGE